MEEGYVKLTPKPGYEYMCIVDGRRYSEVGCSEKEKTLYVEVRK